MKTFRNKDEIETCFKYLFMKTVHFPFLGFGNEKKQEKVQSISGGHCNECFEILFCFIVLNVEYLSIISNRECQNDLHFI